MSIYDEDGEETPVIAISLEEFEARMTRDFEAFCEKWRLSHEDAPDDWPMSMGISDWLEQFLCDISE